MMEYTMCYETWRGRNPTNSKERFIAGKSSNFWVEIPASQVSSPEMFLFSAVWRFSAIQRWEA